MDLFDNIKRLSKSRGKNVKQVALELGFGENIFYAWKKQTPSADKLQAVADYFNVSVDYLMGRDTSEMQKLDPAEDKIVTMFRKNTAGMTEEEKEDFNESMDKLMSVAKELFERDKKQ